MVSGLRHSSTGEKALFQESHHSQNAKSLSRPSEAAFDHLHSYPRRHQSHALEMCCERGVGSERAKSDVIAGA
jgi:hypothetical protein